MEMASGDLCNSRDYEVFLVNRNLVLMY